MYIYIYIYIYVHVSMYVYMYLCMYTCIYVCIYVYMYICIYLCIHVYMYVCIYTCIYVCMYLYMYICMYVSIYVCMSNESSDYRIYLQKKIKGREADSKGQANATVLEVKIAQTNAPQSGVHVKFLSHLIKSIFSTRCCRQFTFLSE